MNLALFDLDHTLLPIDSDFSWAEFLSRQGLAGDPAAAQARNQALAARYHAGTLDIHESMAFMLGLLSGLDTAVLQAAQQRFMDEVIRPAVSAAACDLVNKHRKQGDLCAIVTATNTFVTGPIAPLFGIEHLIGTQPEQRNGRFTGKIEGVPCFQAGKIVKVQAWLAQLGQPLDSFDATFFYSDSINDVALLEAVTHPIATNPSPALREHARRERWPILDLFQ